MHAVTVLAISAEQHRQKQLVHDISSQATWPRMNADDTNLKTKSPDTPFRFGLRYNYLNVSSGSDPRSLAFIRG
jgi:hypothetical protein